MPSKSIGAAIAARGRRPALAPPARAPGPRARRPGSGRAAAGRGRSGWRGRRSRRAASRSAGSSLAGVDGAEVERDAERSSGRPARASPATARPWPSSRWCARAQRGLGVLHARARARRRVAEEGRAPRLVERDPVPARGRRSRSWTSARVVGEALGGVAARASRRASCERLGEVPVVERDPGLRCRAPAARRRGGVEVEPGLVDRRRARRAAAAARRARSGRRRCRARAISSTSSRTAVVVVAGNVAGVAVRDLARACGENVSQIDGARPSSSTAPSIW